MSPIQIIKENRRKWVEALRSGNFKQGRGTLVSQAFGQPPAYCCLGVCRKVAGLEETELHNYAEIRDSVGLTEQDKDLLVTMNDILCLSFEEIADHIETRPILRKAKP